MNVRARRTSARMVGGLTGLVVPLMVAAGCQEPPEAEQKQAAGGELVEQAASIDDECDNQCDMVCRDTKNCQASCNIWEEHRDVGEIPYRHCKATTCGAQSGLPCEPDPGDDPRPDPPPPGTGGDGRPSCSSAEARCRPGSMWLTGQHIEWRGGGGASRNPSGYTVVVDEWTGREEGASYCLCASFCASRQTVRCAGTLPGGNWSNGACGAAGGNRAKCNPPSTNTR
jgi:hypothetical protein